MAVSKVILNGETLIDVTQKTVTPSNMLSGITALKNDGTDITGSIAAKSAADLVTSGSQVTVPSGMYVAAATTAIASGSMYVYGVNAAMNPGTISLNSATGVITVASKSLENQSIHTKIQTAGYLDIQTQYATLTVSVASNSYQLPIHGDLTASGSVITVPSGWYGTAASTAIAAGSITIPSYSFDIKPDITLNSATGKIDLWKSLAYTIPVSLTSGYIAQASGPRVDATVDSSYQLPVKAAATIVPSTVDQVVASGYFLTGAQTIKGDANLVASNIITGASIFGVVGTAQGSAALESGVAPPSQSDYLLAPNSSYDGFSEVLIKGAPLQVKTVTPSSTQQVIVPDNSLYGIIPAGNTACTITYGDGTIDMPMGEDGAAYYFKGKLKIDAVEIVLDGEVIYNKSSGTDLTQIATISGASWSGTGLKWTEHSGWYAYAGITVKTNLGSNGDLIVVEDFTIDTIPVGNYYGLSSVTVEAVAATSSYYLAQDTWGYLCYSSIAPASGSYYIINANVEQIEEV